MLNPTRDHLSNDHNYAPCLQRQLSERTFERKDGLQQHLAWVHSQDSISSYMVEHWSQHGATGPRQWACGICSHDFRDWNTRLKHIGHHWDAGLGMKDWVDRDALQGIQADNPPVSGSERGEKHFRIASRQLSGRSCTSQFTVRPEAFQTETFKPATAQPGTAQPATVSPVSRSGATFFLKDLLRRFSKPQK
jgi:hypothetical protein